MIRDEARAFNQQSATSARKCINIDTFQRNQREPCRDIYMSTCDSNNVAKLCATATMWQNFAICVQNLGPQERRIMHDRACNVNS